MTSNIRIDDVRRRDDHLWMTLIISDGSDSRACCSSHVKESFIRTVRQQMLTTYINVTCVDVITARLVVLEQDSRIIVCQKKTRSNSERGNLV